MLSISIAALFSLTKQGESHQRLYSSEQLESIIENVLGKQKFWGFGVPKAVGEFVAVGDAYFSKTLDTAEVGIKVANQAKQLMVKSTDMLNISGFQPDHKVLQLLENIDITQKMLTISAGVMPENFNIAPLDQRLNRLYQGDETIEIRNMHPLFPIMKTSLPGMRLRVFALQHEAQEQFLEMVTQADTLWLLPNLECGILVYRATCPIANADASDIKCIYSVEEELKNQPKMMDHYLQQFLALSNTQTVEASDNKIDEGYEAISTQFGSDESTETVNEPLVASEINEEEMILDLIRKINNSEVLDLSGLDAQYQVLLGKFSELTKQNKLTEEVAREYIQERKMSGLTPYPTEEEIIESFKDGWVDNPEMEKKVRDAMQSLKQIRLAMHRSLSMQGGKAH